jgi:uncharacterized membrane protein
MARERVLGLPIGKQKKPKHQMAKMAGTAAAILVPAIAVPVARKATPLVRKVSRATGDAEELLGKGRELTSKASDVMETASNVKESVSSHRTTIGKVGGLISAVAKGGGKGESGGNKPKLSHLIEQHTDISAPRSVVYNQWTQFEMFPTLTKGIESASQEEDDKVKLGAKIGPSRRTWTGKIVEQVPDERMAWKSEGGASIQGVVTFHSLDIDLTRVLLQMEYKPTGAVEWVGNTLRVQRRRAKRDLRLFKHFVEMRGEETGAWRGHIDAEEPLEPQYAGQGQVEGERTRAGRGSSGSKRASSGSRSRSSSASKTGSSSKTSSASKTSNASRSSRAGSATGRRTVSRSAASRSSNGQRSTSAAKRTNSGRRPATSRA